MKQTSTLKSMVAWILLFSIFWVKSTIPVFAGASFLKLGIGARALGLGSAYTAIANDVTALYWNPAGLAQLNKRELSAMHGELLYDTRYDFVGYAHPTSKGIFGVGAVYLSHGSLEGRSEDRKLTSDFSAHDFAVTLGASRYITKNTGVGLNLKLIESTVDTYSSKGFAFDAGVIHSLQTYPLSLGFVIQNVGPKMKFENEGSELPLTFASGAAYRLTDWVIVSMDLKHQPRNDKTVLGVGTEISPISILSFRAGYLMNTVRSPSTSSYSSVDGVDLTGLDFGLGFRLGFTTVDYSFALGNELGNAQRISLSLKF